MPRAKSNVPRLVSKQKRQARYRARLQEAGRPEASKVDVAVAAATATAFRWLRARIKAGQMSQDDPRFHLLETISKEATKTLVASGSTEDEATLKLAKRLRPKRHYRDAAGEVTPPITSHD